MLASLYAGVLTALIAYAAVYFLQSDNLVFFGVALLLTGIGPVLGYAFASGRVGASIPGLIGGIIGSIIPLVSILLWPILVASCCSVVLSARSWVPPSSLVWLRQWGKTQAGLALGSFSPLLCGAVLAVQS
jgi:hypothetical protein